MFAQYLWQRILLLFSKSKMHVCPGMASERRACSFYCSKCHWSLWNTCTSGAGVYKGLLAYKELLMGDASGTFAGNYIHVLCTADTGSTLHARSHSSIAAAWNRGWYKESPPYFHSNCFSPRAFLDDQNLMLKSCEHQSVLYLRACVTCNPTGWMQPINEACWLNKDLIYLRLLLPT